MNAEPEPREWDQHGGVLYFWDEDIPRRQDVGGLNLADFHRANNGRGNATKRVSSVSSEPYETPFDSLTNHTYLGPHRRSLRIHPSQKTTFETSQTGHPGNRICQVVASAPRNPALGERPPPIFPHARASRGTTELKTLCRSHRGRRRPVVNGSLASWPPSTATGSCHRSR